MIESFNVICHSAIRIVADNKIIYIDPFCIEKEENDADYICITHSHYDHFSREDINKILKDTTKIITVESAKEDAEKILWPLNGYGKKFEDRYQKEKEEQRLEEQEER